MAKKLTDRELNSAIDFFVSRLSTKIAIDKVILYGSYAKQSAHDWSDIDLMIVSRDLSPSKPKGANGLHLMKLAGFDACPLGLEVIGIHPDCLNNPITKEFFDEVLASGQECLLA